MNIDTLNASVGEGFGGPEVLWDGSPEERAASIPQQWQRLTQGPSCYSQRQRNRGVIGWGVCTVLATAIVVLAVPRVASVLIGLGMGACFGLLILWILGFLQERHDPNFSVWIGPISDPTLTDELTFAPL